MNTTTDKLHPFEAAGMGSGPYRFLYTCQIPSASLAEHNPTAYNNGLRGRDRLRAENQRAVCRSSKSRNGADAGREAPGAKRA